MTPAKASGPQPPHPALRDTWARWSLRSCDQVGAHPQVHGRPRIENLGRLLIGDRLVLHSEPVPTHLTVGRGAVLRIGADVEIAHGCGISAATEVVIGDGVVLGPFVLVMDSDFHRADDRSQPGEARPIALGAGCRIGPRVTLLRGARVGAGTQVLAGSVVGGELPPCVVAAGIPAQVLPGPGGEQGEPAAGVPEIVRRTLGLARRPLPDAGPAELSAWDSLGALNLLLALERAFGVTLPAEAVLRAQTVRGLGELVEAASATGATTALPQPPG